MQTSLGIGRRKVIQALADRSDCGACGQRDDVKRLPHKFPFWHTLACQSDHGRRYIDAKDSVAGAEENFRPSPTAAAQIDDQAGTYAEVPEQIKNSRRSTGGKTAEADIVDVDEVFPVHLTHIPSIRACG